MKVEQRWFVYLLRCRGGRLYCGVTNHLGRRLAEHRSGRAARFTRSFPPEGLAVARVVAGRAAALRLEAALKGMPRERKLRGIVEIPS